MELPSCFCSECTILHYHVGGFQFIYNFVNSGYCPAFFFLILTKVKVLMAPSTLCDPRNCSLPGSSVHGILQARIPEWVAIPFSWGSFNPGIEPRSPAFQAVDSPLNHQGISVGVKWYHIVLICIPLMTDVTGHLLMCCWLFVYLLWRNVFFKSFIHFCICLLFCHWTWGVSYISKYSLSYI